MENITVAYNSSSTCISKKETQASLKTFEILSLVVMFVVLGAALALSVREYKLRKLNKNKHSMKMSVIPSLMKIIRPGDALELSVQEDTGETAILPDHVFSHLQHPKNQKGQFRWRDLGIIAGVYTVLTVAVLVIVIVNPAKYVKFKNCKLVIVITAWIAVFKLVICLVATGFYWKWIQKWSLRCDTNKKDDEQIADICSKLLEEKFKEAFPINDFYTMSTLLGKGGFGEVHEYQLSEQLIRDCCTNNGIYSSHLIDYVSVLLRDHCEDMVAVKEFSR